MRGRRIAEGSRAGKDIREGVASGFYLDAPALARRNRNVDVARVCSHALDRPGFAPELAADHAGAGTVVLGDLGDGARRNVLIARVGHLESGGQVGPQLEAMHAAVRVTFRHL